MSTYFTNIENIYKGNKILKNNPKKSMSTYEHSLGTSKIDLLN